MILVDGHDRPVGWGGTGEICVRSVHWMVGYHNRPDATEECRYVDDQGAEWLRTGDIGRTDEAGFLYITDRKKDMILSGGQNIYPVDLEAILIEHPLISEVAVIGITDATWGETPIAIIVPKPSAAGLTDLASDILAWANTHLGRRQRLQRVELVGDLPRNPNGKVLKRDLREMFR